MRHFFKTIIVFLFLTINVAYSQFTPKMLFDNGLEAFYGARFQDAIKFFDEYIKINQSDFKGYTYRGLSYQAMKNFPRSIEDFTKVISVTPNNSNGYMNRGNSYYFSGNMPSALRDFKDAIRLTPKDIEAYFGISRVFMSMRQFSDALKAVTSAEGIDPTNARVYINKSFIRLQQKDSMNFFNDVKTALYYDSNIVFTDYRRDLIYVRIEVYKNALNAINAMLALNPNSYMDYFARGFFYFLTNSFPKSRADLETAVQINRKTDPKFNDLIDKLFRSINRNSNE